MDQEDKNATISNNEENIEIIDTEKLEANYSEEILSLKDQNAQLHDKLLRAFAETENARKRYEKLIEEAREYAIVNFCKDLIGVMDNLKRALEHKPQGLEGAVANIIAGVDMTKQEFETIFKKYGLESIEPTQGEKFNYNFHHAISQIVTDEYNPDSIVNTMQIGYKIKDRLLRPAIVTVSKKAE